MGLYALDETGVRVPSSGAFWVAPNAVVVGNVIIEDNASIWFNAVLRGDNEPIRIGAGSNVQDGSVLHTDPGYPLDLGPDCTVGHMVMLHGCTIGRGSLIGIGAIVLNGAVIGENCLIGAGTLIAEGKRIPARSVVIGAPGKIVRTASDDDIARIRSGVESYQRNWRRFAGLHSAGMTPQTA
jgi:carbonic anhydrase/acetyltransferase-like protein (isoleucine patch superfamily)